MIKWDSFVSWFTNLYLESLLAAPAIQCDAVLLYYLIVIDREMLI